MSCVSATKLRLRKLALVSPKADFEMRSCVKVVSWKTWQGVEKWNQAERRMRAGITFSEGPRGITFDSVIQGKSGDSTVTSQITFFNNFERVLNTNSLRLLLYAMK